MAKTGKPWLETLRERAETSLADLEYLLGYDPMLNEDGTPRVGPDGKPVMVSRCSEASRVKLNLAMVRLHPDNVKADAGVGIRFEISEGAVRLAISTAGEFDRSNVIDVTPTRAALPAAADAE